MAVPPFRGVLQAAWMQEREVDRAAGGKPESRMLRGRAVTQPEDARDGSRLVDAGGARPNGLAREGGTARSDAGRVGARFVRGLREHDLSGLGAEMAYRFLFALFPFAIFVVALAAFVAGAAHIADPAQRLAASLGDYLPGPLAAVVRPEVDRIMSSPRAILFSIGAIVALWSATGGTNALVKGMHRAYDVPEYRPLLIRYVVAVGLTLMAALGVLASLIVIIGGALATQQVATALGLADGAMLVLGIVRWPVVFVVLTAAVSVLYRYAPNVVVPWRWILVGAMAFTLAWLVATAGFALYVANIANYGATYGSLGGVIVLMLWLYLTAVLLLIGAELTAALARELTPHAIRRRRSEEEAARAVEAAEADIEGAGRREAAALEHRASGSARTSH